ncbi:unnamed protein product [Cuscuta epithymum]|nr:unnamed protein product [Cuscuta epithymum]CAH9133408.1 unnamed protein product [Cuscuta epithymum]
MFREEDAFLTIGAIGIGRLNLHPYHWNKMLRELYRVKLISRSDSKARSYDEQINWFKPETYLPRPPPLFKLLLAPFCGHVYSCWLFVPIMSVVTLRPSGITMLQGILSIRVSTCFVKCLCTISFGDILVKLLYFLKLILIQNIVVTIL